MWFAGENDEWLSESAAKPNTPSERAPASSIHEDVHMAIEIPSETVAADSELRNLPEAPPCQIRTYLYAHQ